MSAVALAIGLILLLFMLIQMTSSRPALPPEPPRAKPPTDWGKDTLGEWWRTELYYLDPSNPVWVTGPDGERPTLPDGQGRDR